MLVFCVCTTLLVPGTAFAGADLIQDGDFQRLGLKVLEREADRAWVLRNHGASRLEVQVVDDPTAPGNKCLQYSNSDDGSHNVHVDQLVPVEPERVYELQARVRGDGRLEPVFAIQTWQWANLVSVSCGKSKDWQDVRLLFHTYDNDVVRVEWFPGAQGNLHTGVSGTSWLDDVTIRLLPAPSTALLRSFELQRPRQREEHAPDVAKSSAVGDPLPLRRILARDGVLLYEDGTEVALWGVNFQTALSWEYNGRLRPAGVPETAEALKDISSRNLSQLPLLEANVIRMHLLPSDFSDAQGNVRDSIYLDVLDDLLAQCQEQGIYVYLTLMNEMQGSMPSDSFLASRDRKEWLFDPALASASRRYIEQFLARKNRYTGIRYADDRTIAVIEIINEPRYPTWQELQNDPVLAQCAAAYSQWYATQQDSVPAESLFFTYRFETVKDYLDRMCSVIRSTGCPAPVVWNLNWPGMINQHEDIFQAVADSNVDAISFCCYPGQSDVRNPFWANPADLSGNNYFPYLQKCYSDYSYLRWILGERFTSKAKLVYEFESMYNHSAHLYPAMARLFRALGVQIAPMWQYTLTPVAEYRAGSHYLNAYCTPRKAVSFRIASRVFSATPRYAPLTFRGDTWTAERDWATSFAHDLCMWRDDEAFLYSRDVDWDPLGAIGEPGTIVGCGNSPLVRYDGSGMFLLDLDENTGTLHILPDVHYNYPPWQRKGGRSADRVCQLEKETNHEFTLLLDGWQQHVMVERLDAGEYHAVSTDANRTRFRASAGTYRLTKQR